MEFSRNPDPESNFWSPEDRKLLWRCLMLKMPFSTVGLESRLILKYLRKLLLEPLTSLPRGWWWVDPSLVRFSSLLKVVRLFWFSLWVGLMNMRHFYIFTFILKYLLPYFLMWATNLNHFLTLLHFINIIVNPYLTKLNWLATNSPASYKPTHKRP